MKITKDDISLVPVEKLHLKMLKDWRNDEELMKRNRQWRKLSNVDQENWFEDLYKNKYSENLMYVIQVRKEGILDNAEQYSIPVGVCGLCHIDYINRSAELSIYIGEEKYKDKRVDIIAINKLKHIAFNDMNLKNIWIEVYHTDSESFIVMKTLLHEAGFVETGVVHNTINRYNNFYDSYFYSCYS